MKHFLAFCLAGAVTAALVAGCGGGSSGSSGGGGTVSPGVFQGVYRNVNGSSSSDAGTVLLTINENRSVTFTTDDSAGNGAATTFTGTINGRRATVIDASGDTLDLTFIADTRITGTYTQANGTKGIFVAGTAEEASNLPGSYDGGFNSTDGETGVAFLTIESNGAASGTIETTNGDNFTISGYVVSNGLLYLAYKDSSGYENASGFLTLTNTTLTGTLNESPSGNTVTLSLAPGQTTESGKVLTSESTTTDSRK